MKNTIKKFYACFFFIFVATQLAGCATAPGALYTGLEPLEAGKGDIYLYRTKALYAVAQAFGTRVQDRDSGDLYNGSYLLFRLAPGSYELAVTTGASGKTSRRKVEVKAGERSFFQYDFPTGLFANFMFLGAEIEPRSQAVAEVDLKGLSAAQKGPTRTMALDNRRSFIALNDVDAVPLKNAKGKAAYRLWLTLRTPRAFAIANEESWRYTFGMPPLDPGESPDAALRALQQCAKIYGVNCKLYAVDNRVVWNDDAPVQDKDTPSPAAMEKSLIDEAPTIKAPAAEPVVQVVSTPSAFVAPALAPVLTPVPSAASVTTAPRVSVTPIYGQLLRMSYPESFDIVSEQNTPERYIRVAVPRGESADQWRQQLTVIGMQGMADNPVMTPADFAEGLSREFEKSCPASFSSKRLSNGNVNGYEQSVSISNCGTPATSGGNSETRLLIVLKGTHDYYAIQWAEHSAPSSTPMAIDIRKWLGRRQQISPLYLCDQNLDGDATNTDCAGEPNK